MAMLLAPIKQLSPIVTFPTKYVALYGSIAQLPCAINHAPAEIATLISIPIRYGSADRCQNYSNSID